MVQKQSERVSLLQTCAGVIMVATTKPELGRCSPADCVCSGSRTPSATHGIYIVPSDFDAAYKRAKEAGATISKELYTTDYGSRDFELTDPEGGKWWLLSTIVTDLASIPSNCWHLQCRSRFHILWIG